MMLTTLILIVMIQYNDDYNNTSISGKISRKLYHPSTSIFCVSKIAPFRHLFLIFMKDLTKTQTQIIFRGNINF